MTDGAAGAAAPRRARPVPWFCPGCPLILGRMADPSHPKSRRRTAKPPPDRGDLAQLADRFLDLWQDQLSAVATDPDLAELVARLWTQWLVGPGAWRPPMAAPAPAPPSAAPAAEPAAAPAHDPRTEAPGAAAAAAPPRDHRADLRDLVARLGALEQRLAAVERTARSRRGGVERRTRRR
jgi:hypothetical protein